MQFYTNKNIGYITFEQPQKLFINSLISSNLLSGITTNTLFTQITFYSKNIYYFNDFIQNKFISTNQINNTLTYQLCLNILISIGKQLFYLEQNNITFPWISLNNIIVIDDNTFIFIDVDNLKFIDNTGHFKLITPFSIQNIFVSPEISNVTKLPYRIHYKSIYYSLGLLILHCLDNNLNNIIHTKLYWCIKRILCITPYYRTLLII